MKIVLLAPANSIHTVRWANGLTSLGHTVHVVSQHPKIKELYFDSVTVHITKNNGFLGYYFMVPFVRNIIKEIEPDILNAHYASGYGTTARLVGFTPSLLSVWGSDIYSFPRKSLLHRYILKHNLRFPTAVASTSNCMVKEMYLTHTPEKVFITPFGVDVEKFSPSPEKASKRDKFVIGTVKSLESTYRIDLLIKAFSVFANTVNNVFLEIFGDGSLREELQSLAISLGVQDLVIFRGHIDHSDVPDALRSLDVYVALSDHESFGVAILEASSCGIPVIVSDAEGPAEVVQCGTTGFVVPRGDYISAADKIKHLYYDSDLRNSMGMCGRKMVMDKYSWRKSLEIMDGAYRNTIEIFRGLE